ncbi:unnamed protein product [Effrenium voratum]|uniref:Uncharacterized protein n=1 Tax=Effrenium voratum TaxID=2562239 RepID=A0AA36MMA4_9DINO|nr:unnamed protein product [Effrenium voratum]
MVCKSCPCRSSNTATEPFYNRITAVQVRLRTSKGFQRVVVAVTLFAVFADILGTAVILPGLASVCTFAEGGPGDLLEKQRENLPEEVYQEQIQQLISPHAFKGERGAWSGSPPVKYALSMNLVMSVGYFGSALGSMFLGLLCDKIGCKFPMQLCLFMGIIGYVIIYASAIWVKSYYLFLLGNAWNNFFGNCMQIATTYVGQLFEGEERDSYNSLVIGMGLIGGTIGAFIVMPFSNNPSNGANYFDSIWLAIGVTAAALIAVTVVLVPPQEQEPDREADPATLETPPRAARLLKITVLASALDSGGDEGTRIARGTVLTAVFPEWQTAERQNYLLLGLLVMVILSLVILELLRKRINLAAICVIGCFFTLATQLVLIAELEVAPFLATWYSGKLFGFLSTIASGLIIVELAPKSQLGRWNGINEAFSNLSMAVSPLVFSLIYDAVGNVRGQEMLVCTSAVSLLATMAYMPLVSRMPKPSEEPLELKDLSYYEELSDEDFAELPTRIVDEVRFKKMIEAGKTPRLVSWGSYEQQRAKLYEMQRRAMKDFKDFAEYLVRILSNRELLVQEQKKEMAILATQGGVDREQAKKEMGAWMADYFDDAGYIDWETQATFYKAMIMTAFPPIDSLDSVRPEYHTMSVEKFEKNMTRVLEVMDSHLASHRRIHLNGGVFSLIRGR